MNMEMGFSGCLGRSLPEVTPHGRAWSKSPASVGKGWQDQFLVTVAGMELNNRKCEIALFQHNNERWGF